MIKIFDCTKDEPEIVNDDSEESDKDVTSKKVIGEVTHLYLVLFLTYTYRIYD